MPQAILPGMFRRLLSLLTIPLCCTIPLEARVVRVEVSSRADVLNGQRFGEVGAYERIVGRVYFSIAVTNPHNRRIVDLDKAENLKDGEVEFSADFIAVRPNEENKGNGSMLLEIPNRGRGRIIGLVDGGDWDLSKDLGDAWLLRNGYTIVTLGWQWDAPNALRLYVPVAKGHGKTLKGLLRGDLMPWRPMEEIPLGHLIRGMIGGAEYPVAAPDDSHNALSVRDSPTAKRAFVPRSQWQFAHMVDGKLQPSDRHIYLKSGFQAGKIYEYVYVVENPVIAGLGFAAVRDFASYAKHGSDSIAAAVRVYGEGISQNGRFLRDFLYQGFNADEEGRIALDGVLAHVAGAGRGSFNYRFAQPSRDAQPTSSVFFPTDVFPFTDLPQIDRVTGAKGGLLDAAIAQKVVPKIFYSNTSYEYWGRAAALIHITPDGKRDAPLPSDVRIYHLTGLQHFSSPFPPPKGTHDLQGQSPQSPLPVNLFWRTMIANMDAWVRNGTAPPESSYPKIANGTLVSLSRLKFPAIPGVNKPHEANSAYRLDFGPKWRDGFLTLQPPKVGEAFPVLVPQVDADGNEVSGVRLPQIAFPLATYTGWNLRDPAIGAPDQRVSFLGSYLPFPKTAADCERSGDRRESVAERYVGREDYLNRYSGAVDELVKQRWVLPEDRPALLKRGEQEWDYATK
jgi:Alpha/beta hydrolase domain